MMAGDVILTLARMQKRERRRQPMILTGTIVNSAAIVAGSIAGLLLGKFIPERFSDAMEKGAALCVLYIGVDGMLAGENTLVAILSISIGAILGELLQLDEHMHQLGDWVERKFGGKGSKTSLSDGLSPPRSSSAWGAMAIMGALDSGLTGDHSTLYAKALLDGSFPSSTPRPSASASRFQLSLSSSIRVPSRWVRRSSRRISQKRSSSR